MHATRPSVRASFLVAVAIASGAALDLRAGRAQEPQTPLPVAVADSLATAPVDSLATPVTAAPVDSTGAAPAAPDSTVTAPTAEGRAAPTATKSIAPSRVRVSAATLREVRPETLEDVVEWIAGASVRVAGDNGMPAHVGLSPIASSAPEIWVDGIPTRSPSDLDPGIWDRSAIAVDAVGDWSFGANAAPGDPGLWMQSRDPEPGRVVARTRFSATDAETYQRAISATTPASGRAVRVDFEEWKTESGIEYSAAPGVISRSDAGRSKMRRFRIGTDLETGAGRLRMFFGKGRRYYRGSVISARDRERWTGELAFSLDRMRDDSVVQTRAWHLDFSDEDRIVGQQLDASRTGISVEHLPLRGGWSAALLAERWAARFAPDDSTIVGPVNAVVLRGRAGWTADPARRVVPWVFVQSAHGDHLADPTAVGARAGADLNVGAIGLQWIVERALRVPTLAETDGHLGFHTIDPLDDSFSYSGRTWSWRGSGELGIEEQDRLGMRGRLERRRAQLELGIDHWRLRDGVGWEPDASSAQDLARVRGDAALAVTTVDGSGGFALASSNWALRGAAHGQRVLGTLDPELGRGGGWPDWNLRARLVLDRRFFSVHNRLGLEVDAAGLGPRADDAVAAFSDLRLPARWRVDARLRLSIRDAVLSVGLDNLLDADQDEVLGTLRRGRQLRWQLDWNFFN